MKPAEILMVCTSDIAGQVRGKGFPAALIEERREIGAGWTPTNIMIGNRGAIGPTPWGALGDLYLRPDWSTPVMVVYEGDPAVESFVLADVMELDGTPWACCLRDFLKRGLARLEEAGFRLKAAFEHEFAYFGVEEHKNSAYNLESVRRQGAFGPRLVAALESAHVKVEGFMAEFGPRQYEVTIGAKGGLRAADEAVILRQLVRSTAERQGAAASFAPLLRPDAVGNGVHVHFSLTDLAGLPVSHDPDRPHGIGAKAGAFVEGIRRRMPALCALSAAGTASYQRLVPHRWSAAYTNLGLQDREAGIRVCPVFAREPEERKRAFHFEYRAADAVASPYLLLGGLVAAGVAGLEAGLEVAEPTTSDPSVMSEEDLARHDARPLPKKLSEALALLEADEVLTAALGPVLADAYLKHKRFEADKLEPLGADGQCREYCACY